VKKQLAKKNPKLQPKTIIPPFCQDGITLYPVRLNGKLVYVTVPE